MNSLVYGRDVFGGLTLHCIEFGSIFLLLNAFMSTLLPWKAEKQKQKANQLSTQVLTVRR